MLLFRNRQPDTFYQKGIWYCNSLIELLIYKVKDLIELLFVSVLLFNFGMFPLHCFYVFVLVVLLPFLTLANVVYHRSDPLYRNFLGRPE